MPYRKQVGFGRFRSGHPRGGPRRSFPADGPQALDHQRRRGGFFLLFANANPEAGYRGITAFLIEREFAGFQVGKKEDKLGSGRRPPAS